MSEVTCDGMGLCVKRDTAPLSEPWCNGAGRCVKGYAAPAAEPVPPTDGLRDALRIHHPIMRSETGPFSGCRCGQVRLGEDVIAHVVAELRRALDGDR